MCSQHAATEITHSLSAALNRGLTNKLNPVKAVKFPSNMLVRTLAYCIKSPHAVLTVWPTHVNLQGSHLNCQELYQKELQGQWIGDSVKCSEGEYAVDDYWSWKGWRDSLTGVQALGNVGRR